MRPFRQNLWGYLMLWGKVARVLNTKELALNIGSDAGVQIGMKFDFMSHKLEDIRDPDTNEVLGSINRPKVRVRVSYVDEKLSIATTFKKTTVNIGGTAQLMPSSAFAKALLPPNWVERNETLRTSEKTWDDLDESESYVKTGDVAVEVTARD